MAGVEQRDQSDGQRNKHDLDRFESPNSPQVATFTSDEVTALCPFDFGTRDFYTLTIRYEPDEWALEAKSLRDHLRGLDGKEMTAESLADHLWHAVRETVEPARLYVRVEQNRRGGIEETVEVGDRGLR